MAKKTPTGGKMGASIGGLYVWTVTDYNQLKSTLATLDTRQQHILSTMEALVVDVTSIQTAINDLTAKVAADHDVEASAITLIQGMTTQLKSLQDQIAGMNAGDITQQQLDDLAATIGAQATALDNSRQQLADAVANEGPTPTPNA